MAIANYVQIGNVVDYTAATDIAYKEIVPFAACIGVAAEAIPAGKTGSVSLKGCYEMPAASGAIKIGDAVYFDTENEVITGTSGAKTVPAGIAITAKASAATSIIVRLG
ncbi:MAG: DUF2190 family protein [Selenomonadaceae bacterium]|nr:DUF2190 family protein [Selenomonadaceae bacterium]